MMGVLGVAFIWFVLVMFHEREIVIMNNTGVDLVNLQLNTTFVNGDDRSEDFILKKGQQRVVTLDNEVQAIVLAHRYQEDDILSAPTLTLFDRDFEFRPIIKINNILDDHRLEIE